MLRNRNMVKLIIVKALTLKKSRPKHAWCIGMAKSSRSTCRTCRELISQGTCRVGSIHYYPHRTCRWHHLACASNVLIGCSEDDLWGLNDLDKDARAQTALTIACSRKLAPTRALATVTGTLDLLRFSEALSERYGKFRSFKFGLDAKEQYSNNWNWRCFLATMLVCNTHETAMLRVTDQLFKVYPTPERLQELRDDREAREAWVFWMKKRDLRHASRKMFCILNANHAMLQLYDGLVPKDRHLLEELPGVGRHVASVTMAWVHQAAEFGVDTHVRRILKRWGYIHPKDPEVLIERKIKAVVEPKKIGKFSRAFVDHGQSVCGYTPNCSACHLRFSCPTASKQLEW